MWIFNTDRVLRWILILEEYGSDIKYIKGEKNIVAYALSILPLNRNIETMQKSTYKSKLCQKSMKQKNYLKVIVPLTYK